MAYDPQPVRAPVAGMPAEGKHRTPWLGRMWDFEQRWAQHVLAAFAPEAGPGLSPAANEVDYVTTTRRMLRQVNPWAAIGLRLAIWIAALAPFWLWGKFVTVSKLAGTRRAELLRALLAHRFMLVRELTLLLKLCAAIALLGTPSVRARSGYDQVAEAKLESGVRIRLPERVSLPQDIASNPPRKIAGPSPSWRPPS